jgi:hypothetical protein
MLSQLSNDRKIKDIVFELEILMTQSNKKTLAADVKLRIEKQKIELIKSIKQNLNNSLEPQPISDTIPPVVKTNKYNQLGLWFVLAILLAFDFAPMIIGGLMYAQESLSTLIPYLPVIIASPHVMTVLGLGCVLSSIFGSICFVAPILMDRLGIIPAKNNASIENCYFEQINDTEQINNSLLSDNDLTSEETWPHLKLAKLLNKNMQCLKENYRKANHSNLHRLFSWAITGLMAIQCVAGSLFMASGLIGWLMGSTLAVTALISTMPVVTAVVAIGFFIPQLVTTYILRTRSADEFLGQGVKSHDELKNKIKDFKVINYATFEKVHNRKLAHEINSYKVCAKQPDFIKEIKERAKQVKLKSLMEKSSFYLFWKPTHLAIINVEAKRSTNNQKYSKRKMS